MARTIIVGDVHGCVEELERLLDRLAFSASDRLCFVGDLVARGPDSPGVLRLVRRTKARVVRGNHEEKLVLWWEAKQNGENPDRLGPTHRKVARELDGDDWRFLRSLPLWIDLPEHDLRIVHAGIVPGVPMNEQPREALLKMRSLGPSGEPWQEDGRVRWGARWAGPPHVVFGHNAQHEPQIHPWATGIDTAAVYGGRLMAMVLAEGQEVPPPADREAVLVSVRARKRYFVPKM